MGPLAMSACLGLGFLCQSPCVVPYSAREGGSGALY